MKVVNSIFTMVVAVLVPVWAMAITEADLTPAFPGLQAELLYDLATQGTVEDTDIVFSASGTITSTGVGSDITVNPVDQFIVAASQDTNRLLRFSGSSDTSMTLSFGDAAIATQTMSIVSSSTDGADNDYLCLSGGGSCVAATRGSWISIYGNETAEAGDIVLNTGSASGSSLFLTAGATNGTIVASTNGTTALTVESDQDAVFASEITSSETGSLGWSVVDGTNDTACTSQCTSAAVFGLDLNAGPTAPVIVGPSAVGADICVCAGAS